MYEEKNDTEDNTDASHGDVGDAQKGVFAAKKRRRRQNNLFTSFEWIHLEFWKKRFIKLATIVHATTYDTHSMMGA